MAVIFTDDFARNTNAEIDISKWVQDNNVTNIPIVISERMRHTTSAATISNYRISYPVTKPLWSAELLVRVTLAGLNYVRVGLASSGGRRTTSPNQSIPNNGFMFEVAGVSDTTATLSFQSGGSGTDLSTTLPWNGTTTARWIRMRYDHTTATLSVRSWDDGGSEPGTWDYSAVQSPTITAPGSVFLANQSTGTSSTYITYFDSVEVDDLDYVPSGNKRIALITQNGGLAHQAATSTKAAIESAGAYTVTILDQTAISIAQELFGYDAVATVRTSADPANSLIDAIKNSFRPVLYGFDLSAAGTDMTSGLTSYSGVFSRARSESASTDSNKADPVTANASHPIVDGLITRQTFFSGTQWVSSSMSNTYTHAGTPLFNGATTANAGEPVLIAIEPNELPTATAGTLGPWKTRAVWWGQMYGGTSSVTYTQAGIDLLTRIFDWLLDPDAPQYMHPIKYIQKTDNRAGGPFRPSSNGPTYGDTVFLATYGGVPTDMTDWTLITSAGSTRLYYGVIDTGWSGGTEIALTADSGITTARGATMIIRGVATSIAPFTTSVANNQEAGGTATSTTSGNLSGYARPTWLLSVLGHLGSIAAGDTVSFSGLVDSATATEPLAAFTAATDGTVHFGLVNARSGTDPATSTHTTTTALGGRSVLLIDVVQEPAPAVPTEVETDVATSWDVLVVGGTTPVETTLASAWDTRASISTTKTLAWNVPSIVTKTVSLTHTVRQAVSTTQSAGTWSVTAAPVLPVAFRAAGAVRANQTYYPVGALANDVLILALGGAAAFTDPDWTLLTQTTSSAGRIYWKRHTGSATTGNEYISNTGFGQITAWSGVATSGNPFNTHISSQPGTLASSTTTADLNGYDKTNPLVIAIHFKTTDIPATTVNTTFSGITGGTATRVTTAATSLGGSVGPYMVYYDGTGGTDPATATFSHASSTNRSNIIFDLEPALVPTPVETTISTSWSQPDATIPTPVETTAAVSYDVRAVVTKTHGSNTWSTSAAISKTVASSWGTYSVVTTTKSAGTWQVTTAVPVTQSVSWTVAGPVIKTVASAWDARAVVSKTVVSNWNSVIAVSTTKSAGTWDARQAVSKTVATEFTAYTPVAKTVNNTWTVVSSVQTTKASSWNTRYQVVTGLGPSNWAVGNPLGWVVVDPSSPGYITSSGAAATSQSFTPPAGSFIAVAVASVAGPSVFWTMSVTDSAGRTYSRLGNENNDVQSFTNSTKLELWVAAVTTSSATTITVTPSTTVSGIGARAFVLTNLNNINSIKAPVFDEGDAGGASIFNRVSTARNSKFFFASVTTGGSSGSTGNPVLTEQRVFNASSAAGASGWKTTVGDAGTAIYQEMFGQPTGLQAMSFEVEPLPDPATVTGVQTTKDVLWSTKERVTATLASSYTVTRAVGTTVASTWATIGIAQTTKAVSYGVKTVVDKTAPVSFNVTTPVSLTLATSFTTFRPVSKTVATSFNTAASVNATKTTSYNVRTSMSKTTATEWIVFASAPVTTTASAGTWTVRAAVSTTKPTTWSTRAVMTKNTAAVWSTYTNMAAPKTHATVYTVYTRVAPKTASTAWGTRAIVSTVKSLEWTIRDTLTSTATAEWNVWMHTEEAERPVSWTTFRPVSDTYNTTWGQRALAIKKAATTWRVLPAEAAVAAGGETVRLGSTHAEVQLGSTEGRVVLLNTLTNVSV